VRVFLSMGANVGNRADYLRSALEKIARIDGTKLIRTSDCYASEPWGQDGQSPFLNIAAEIETDHAPLELLRATKTIEHDLGRTPGPRWGPREIDIDIILWGDEIMETSELSIPHKHFRQRRFVLEPIAEFAPDVRDPESG